MHVACYCLPDKQAITGGITVASLIPAVGYVRVSKTNGRLAKGESFIAPDVQRRSIEAAAAGKYRVVAWYEEHDVSGTTNKRPEFQAALAMIERGEAKAMIVSRLSRFTRSAAGGLESLERLEAAGAALVAADLGVDTSTPGGKLIRQVFMAMAEFEADLIRENFLLARESAVARGLKLGPCAPFGYRFRDAKRDRRLVIDEDKAKIVRELFVRKAGGAAVNELIDWCHAVTGEWLTPHRMAGIFRNRTYLGESRSGEFVNAEAHDALVTHEVWNAANAALPPARKSRNPNGGGLLAGVMTCTGCGKPMTYSSSSTESPTYRCQRRSADGKCPAPVSVVAAEADAYVTAQFLAWARAKAVVVASVPDEDEAALNAARVALDAAERELAAWRDLPIADVASPDVFLAGLATRQAAVDEAADKVTGIHVQGHRDRLSLEVVEHWDSVPVEGKRRILKQVAVAEVAPSGRVGPGPWLPVPERIALTFRDA